MITLSPFTAAALATAPLFPPNPRDHRIIDRIYDHQIPDANANNLRLCVKGGRVCAFYREKKASGITITIPFGRVPK